jgi:glucose/arabinose dehydrogenase
MTTRPGSTSLYLTEKDGRVRRVAMTGTGTDATYTVDPTPVLDLSGNTTDDGERGLLGIAFSTDGSSLYVHYTDKAGTVTVDAYAMHGETADPGSRRNLISLPHQYPNHNGGQLQVGPDGYLYIGPGDGGSGGDPDGNGQNPHTLLGKILRIDPTGTTGTKPYAIPPDNPFADGKDGAPEVWMFGLRNPWRFSFDRTTKDLWIGDVGQNAYEEIDFLPHTDAGAGRGANLGWNRMEGTHPYNGGTPPPNYTPPIFDYSHDNGECSVTGGYVYRGPVASWQGVYVFADYCQGEIRLLLRQADGTVHEQGTGVHVANGDLESGGSITSFGEELDGTLLALSAAGDVYRLDLS